MKISGDHKSPDYWRNHFKVCLDVFLDGVLQHHVVEADTVQGFVIVELWRNGKPDKDESGEAIARQHIVGKVSIVEFPPPRTPGVLCDA